MTHRTAARRTRAGLLCSLAVLVTLALPGSAYAAHPRAAQPAAASAARPALPPPVQCASCWVPPLDTSWDWVLSRVPSAPYRDVAMYDIDGFEASAADVSAMHADGIHVVCYIDAGTWERWRKDAGEFPKRLLGRKDGWPGERWLDIRGPARPHSVLLKIMRARLAMCADKGFDAVELDNVDGYTNKTGFPLTARDQLRYDVALANATHRLGMSVLQKNDNAQIPTLLPYFDAALNEQCNQYHECTTKQTGRYGYDEYVDAGKAVFQVEYKLATKRFCPADNAADFNGIRLDLNLDGRRFQPCRS